MRPARYGVHKLPGDIIRGGHFTLYLPGRPA